MTRNRLDPPPPPPRATTTPTTGSVADRIERAIAAVLGNPADTDYPNAANLTRAVMDALQVPDEEDLAGLRGSLLLLAEGHDARGMNSDADLLRTAEAVIRLQRIREQSLQSIVDLGHHLPEEPRS